MESKFYLPFVLLLSLLLALTEGYPNALQTGKFFVHHETLGPQCGTVYSGCCKGEPSECFKRDDDGNYCFCDEACHATGMCCSDIEQIECFATTCENAGLLPGCCIVTANNDCRVSKKGCFCDKQCNRFKDCCDDVPDDPQCEDDMTYNQFNRDAGLRMFSNNLLMERLLGLSGRRVMKQ